MIFAPCSGLIPEDAWNGIDLESAWRGEAPIADLPGPDSSFRSGAPVLSAFHQAKTAEACLAGTLEVERAWIEKLRSWSSSDSRN